MTDTCAIWVNIREQVIVWDGMVRQSVLNIVSNALIEIIELNEFILHSTSLKEKFEKRFYSNYSTANYFQNKNNSKSLANSEFFKIKLINSNVNINKMKNSWWSDKIKVNTNCQIDNSKNRKPDAQRIDQRQKCGFHHVANRMTAIAFEFQVYEIACVQRSQRQNVPPMLLLVLRTAKSRMPRAWPSQR